MMDASIERIIRRRYRAEGIIVSIDPRPASSSQPIGVGVKLRQLAYSVVQHLKKISVANVVVVPVTKSLWPPYVIGGPLYFCPVVSFFLLSIFFYFLA